MSTGELLVARAAMKPLATLNRPVLSTVDVVTKEETVSFKERTDVTAVPAMGVVAETMVALVLADEALRKFGGDSVDELVDATATAYLAALARAGPRLRRSRAASALEHDRARRDDGRGQDARRPAPGPAARLAASSTATSRSRRWTGRTVAEIFAADGEAAFRAIEAEVLGRGAGVGHAVGDRRRPAARCSTRRNRRLAARARHRRVAAGRPCRRWPSGSATATPPAARRRPEPRSLARLDAERAPALREVADVVVDVDDLDRAPGRRRAWPRLERWSRRA